MLYDVCSLLVGLLDIYKRRQQQTGKVGWYNIVFSASIASEIKIKKDVTEVSQYAYIYVFFIWIVIHYV